MDFIEEGKIIKVKENQVNGEMIRNVYFANDDEFFKRTKEENEAFCEFTIDILKSFPNFKYDDELNLPYIIASEFVRYMISLVNTDDAELKKCLEYIERLYSSKYHCIKELATIGFVEDIQNTCPEENINLIYNMMGKNTKKSWKELNKFWKKVSNWKSKK